MSDLGEFRQEIRRMQADLRIDLAEARNASRDNQREIEVVKGQIDEVRHQSQVRSQPSADSKRITEIEKKALLLEGEMRSGRGEIRGLQEDFQVMRDELRIQREETKNMRGAIARLSDRSAGNRPTLSGEGKEIPCDLAKGGPLQAPEEYQEALHRMCREDFKGAIAKFREFQKKFPKSDLAGNAQHWVGESYYAMKEYERAILEFHEVLKMHPGSSRVPAALLKQGLSFYELGHREDAKLVLEKLIQEYPSAEEAEKARTKLRAAER
jgi:tol-pal system protein YbgF